MDSVAEPADEHPADGGVDERTEKVFGAISRLPERLGQVLLLRYCDRLSMREIAEATGSSVGTVTSRLSRALARLRETLGTVAKES